MKKQAFLFLVLVAPLVFTSCEKEETLTPAEFNAKQLAQYTTNNGIFLANIFLSQQASGREVFERLEYRSTFQIEAPFFIAIKSGRHYHMDRLLYFEKDTGYDDAYEINLYFR